MLLFIFHAKKGTKSKERWLKTYIHTNWHVKHWLPQSNRVHLMCACKPQQMRVWAVGWLNEVNNDRILTEQQVGEYSVRQGDLVYRLILE